MAGKPGRSGGPGRGQGKKLKRLTIEAGLTISLARVSNDGETVYPAVAGEVIRVGGDDGHDRQFVIVTAAETLTIFIDAAPDVNKPVPAGKVDTRNLTTTQIKKLAALKKRDQCYIVLEGNRQVCLVHNSLADNQQHCRKSLVEKSR